MKKLLCVLTLCLLMSLLTACKDNNPKPNDIVKLPDEQTKYTANGYRSDIETSKDADLNESSDISSDVSSVDTTTTYFVASKKSKKFHTPECIYAAKINQENKLLFQNVADAEEKGYFACGSCFK